MGNLTEKIMTLEKKISLCWESFITSKIEEGMKQIYTIFNDIEEILNEIQGIGLKSFDINQIEDMFSKLEMALKFPDYILVADLLNYEIKPIVKSWESELSNLIGNL